MSEERLQILRMLESGKISAEAAANLLEAVDSPSPPNRPKTLKVRIVEPNRRANTISVSIGMADWLLRWVGSMVHVNVDGAQIDLEKIGELIRAGVPGKVVDIEDGGRRIEVWLE